MRPKESTQAYFAHLPTNRIKANALNPRKTFERQSLVELAASLSSHGVLQPLIVYEKRGWFVLICGERRLRAARLGKLKVVPAIVHPIPPRNESIVSMMLIENLQRKDVDVVNESAAIRLLIEEHNWSLARVSRTLGAGAGFIRNRYLLTKFSDVLSAFTNNTISYSEAIELATIEDKEIRKWFFRRIETGELSDIKKLSVAVTRDKQIRAILEKRTLEKQPLDRAKVEFQVPGLPYCDPNCPHYFRVSWDEKKQYKIPHQKPGWAEFCMDKCGDCYAQKVKAKHQKLARLRAVKVKRPISDHDVGSLMWLSYKGKSCRTCKWMVEATSLDEAGVPLPPKVHAACTCPSAECYDVRTKILAQRASRLELQDQKAGELRKRLLLEELNQSPSRTHPLPRAQLTKRECAFVLLQYLCFLGGQPRLREFAERHGWLQNLPSHINSQMRYIRNKLLDEISEADLHDVLLNEASLAVVYSHEPFPPLKFRRDLQSEIPVQLTQTDE